MWCVFIVEEKPVKSIASVYGLFQDLLALPNIVMSLDMILYPFQLL